MEQGYRVMEEIIYLSPIPRRVSHRRLSCLIMLFNRIPPNLIIIPYRMGEHSIYLLKIIDVISSVTACGTV